MTIIRHNIIMVYMKNIYIFMSNVHSNVLKQIPQHAVRNLYLQIIIILLYWIIIRSSTVENKVVVFNKWT